jgi:transposase
VGSLHRLLERLGIAWKRGRDHQHSPDPDYFSKLQFVLDRIEDAVVSEGRIVVVFLDELTYYRQPSVANAYETKGNAQPLAERSCRSNTPTRVIGAVNALNGRVHFWQGVKTGVAQFVTFYQRLCEGYPKVERMYVVQDNWPIHFHPDLLIALEEQERSSLFRPCPHWKTKARRKQTEAWGTLQLPIQIAPLPTYAPWTNPIEKLWRWGCQEVLHLHRLADHLNELRERFAAFLERFADGSQDLLRYIGLSDPSKLYASARGLLPRPPSCPY